MSGRGSKLSLASLDWAPLRSLFPMNFASCESLPRRFSEVLKKLQSATDYDVANFVVNSSPAAEDLQEAKVLVR